MSVLAIIPARAGSKGIEGKNFRLLAGISPLERAIYCAYKADVHWRVVTTDRWPLPLLYLTRNTPDESPLTFRPNTSETQYLQRPPELAQDDTPMIDVVKHALAQIPGPPEQIIVLLQPTQPLRTPEHVRAAIALLESSGADSVVSVVVLPQTHHPQFVCWTKDDRLYRWPRMEFKSVAVPWDWDMLPTRRQAVAPVYIRDGTCYAFRRYTVDSYHTLYGRDVRPLLIPASETCALDTPADWADAERRLQA